MCVSVVLFFVQRVAKSAFFMLLGGARDTVASTASVATLADFPHFQVPCPKIENRLLGYPKPLSETEADGMANRKRPIVLRCPVTAEERELIERKMAQLPTQRIGAYLRKMAIDGYIIYTDTADIKAFTAELSAIGKNINQIARRINSGAPIYQADMEEIKERLDEIWQLQRHILSNQR